MLSFTGRLASYSTFQSIRLMFLESAMTKAGICTSSTVNLPAPVKITAVPSSMKMLRSMSVPTLMFTGQSTTNVNAPCLAAANAFATPAVSSDVPVQLTHSLMVFLTTGIVGAGDVGVAVGAEPVPLLPVAVVPVVVPVVVVVAVVPVVEGLPEVMLSPAPVLLIVPTTVPEFVELVDTVASAELPLVDPQPASGNAKTRVAKIESIAADWSDRPTVNSRFAEVIFN
jgi:hypothetical protein